MKKKLTQPFNIAMMALVTTLTILCFVGWNIVSKFVVETENTLSINAETKEENDEQQSEYVEPPKQEEPVVEIEVIEITDEQERQDIIDLATEIAKKYANFTSDDLDFKEIKNYFSDDSEMVERLETYNSNRYNSHISFDYDNINIESVGAIDDNEIVCHITFDYIINVDKSTTNVYPSNYKLYFYRDSMKLTTIEMIY